MKTLTLSHPTSKKAPFHPPEDALYMNKEGTILAVADGVTRSVNADGHYPNPSPASLAANVFCKTAATTKQVNNIFSRANAAIAALNTDLGLSPEPDYFTRDLAGTVAAVAIREGSNVIYGYIGDCGVAVLHQNGELVWHTPDALAQTAKSFPPNNSGMSPKERQILIRRDFRNKPKAPHPTYGVLTGEPEALAYVKIATTTLTHGDILVVYSDGAWPLLQQPKARRLIAMGAKQELEDLIHTQRAQNDLAGDLSLLAVAL